MKKGENTKELIASFPWPLIIDRIVMTLHCSLEELGRQVGVSRQAIEGYHSASFSPKTSTALSLLLAYCQIADPSGFPTHLLFVDGLSEAEIRLLRQSVQEMKKKQERVDELLAQKASLEVELRKAQIELLQAQSTK